MSAQKQRMEKQLNTVLYGVWDGRVYDYRDGSVPAATALPSLVGLDAFAPDNTVKAFVADRGFLVFDASVNLTDTFWQYMQRAADESCGKCTPCRVGTCALRDQLDRLRQGQGRPSDLNEIHAMAELVSNTSLCGLGQSCSRALESALSHFSEVFEQEMNSGQAVTQYGMVYATAPCIEACPSKLDVPRYIDYIRDGKPSHGGITDLQIQIHLGQTLFQCLELDTRNRLDMPFIQRMEHHHIVNPVNKLRSEMPLYLGHHRQFNHLIIIGRHCLNLLTANIRGHEFG